MNNKDVETLGIKLDRVLNAAAQHGSAEHGSWATRAHQVELAYKSFALGVSELERGEYYEALRHLRHAVEAGVEEARSVMNLCLSVLADESSDPGDHSNSSQPSVDSDPVIDISEGDNSEILRVEILRAVWSKLAIFVRTQVCDDQNLMTDIMHEAAATFTYYWREKGKLNQEQALSVLRLAAKQHGRQGRYHLDMRHEIEAVLLDLD